MRRAGGAIPYVIGQWVCGERFYGREALLAEILEGPRAWHWLAGLRRIGKTSLLRQLDHLAGGAEMARGSILPIFWDLQGVETATDLAPSFGEALLDSEERLATFGIEVEELEAEGTGLVAAIESLKGAARRQGAELLLLLDEADALLDLAASDPALPEPLWKALGEGTRIVLASSLRLIDLGLDPQSGRAVPGLRERFGEPRLLGVLQDGDARELLRQTHLPEPSRPVIEDREVEAIRERCGDHPMLLQILGKRLQELGDLEEAFRQVEADHSVHHLFAVDFELLAARERAVLEAVAREESREVMADAARRSIRGASEGPIDLAGQPTERLMGLGLLRAVDTNGLTIPNRFLVDWLRRRKAD